MLKADDSFMLVPVASEAEAVGIAAGASLGGKQPALYMEGTGLFVSSYNLLTLGERYGVPMLLLISYIGSMDDRRSTFLYSHYGTHMVPQLEALGIQYEIVKDADEYRDRHQERGAADAWVEAAGGAAVYRRVYDLRR